MNTTNDNKLKLKKTAECAWCGKQFDYKYSLLSDGRFCSRICARRYSQKACTGTKILPCISCGKPTAVNKRTASVNVRCKECAEAANTAKKKPLADKKCKNCGGSMRGSTGKVFCSQTCSNEYRKNNHDRIIEESGGVGYSARVIKPILLKKHNGACDICGTSTWLGKPIMLIMDHINGRANDNRFENLRFICSNCDATLPTYKSKNKHSDRSFRSKHITPVSPN